MIEAIISPFCSALMRRSSSAERLRLAGGLSMQVKRILSEARLVIVEIEVNHEGKLRSGPTLCAVVKPKRRRTGHPPQHVRRPAHLHELDNAVALPK